jgi:hypothetical protein
MGKIFRLSSSKPIIVLILLGTLILPNLSPGLAAPALAQVSNKHIIFSLADLGEDSITVREIYDQREVNFRLAEGLQVEQAVLYLYLEHGDTLLAAYSDLSIALNDEPVVSIILDEKNAQAAIYPIDIPVEAFQPGENTLLLSFNLRLNDNGCSDAGSPSLWVKIDSASYFELDTTDMPVMPDLKRFPAPFDTLSNLPGSPQLAFILPDAPIYAELTAAARIAAALGQAAGWNDPPLRALTVSQVEMLGVAADHLIVINLNERNPLAAGAEPGLAEGISPLNPNRLMLTVTAADEKTLLQEADRLATRSALPGLAAETTQPTAPVIPLPLVELADPRSFAELGFADRRVRGIGLHDVYYPIDLPYDWKVTSEASIDLRFTHARGLRTPESILSVFINGYRTSDIELNNRNAADGRLIVQLSTRQLHPGRNWLHLSVNLHVPHENCRYRYLEEAWFQISGSDSTINLAHVNSQPPLDLRYLPSPLVTPADLSMDVFVLPNRPGWADLTALVRLAAKLGTYSQADGLRPLAMTAVEYNPAAPSSPAAVTGFHIVAIGSPLSNSLLATFDNQLLQPLIPKSGAGIPTGGRALLPEESAAPGQPAPVAGYLQLLPAPWSRQTTLVVVAAYDETGILRVVDAIPSMGERLHAHGNVLVVTPNQVIGLMLGGLAGAPLSNSARVLLAGVLIGVVAAIGVVGWFSNWQRQRTAERESAIHIAESL